MGPYGYKPGQMRKESQGLEVWGKMGGLRNEGFGHRHQEKQLAGTL